MSTTVAYMRVSTSAQLEGSGIDQQRASIGAYAMLNNLKVDEWAVEDETGTSEDREEIQRLLARAKCGELAKLIVDRMDRLGRLLVVCESLYKQFNDAGVEVVLTTMKLENNSAGKLVRQIFGAVAEYQREEWLSRMSSCKKRTAARRGSFTGGVPPLGYRSAGGGLLAIVPDEARTIRRLFELWRVYRGDCGKVTVRLNQEGFRTRDGRSFFYQTVKRIAQRERFYRGVKTPHPPILTETRPMHAETETVETVETPETAPLV